MRIKRNNDQFREVQHLRQWWIWAIIAGVAATGWWAFIEQIVMGKPWGNQPAPDFVVIILWLALGIGLPIAMMGMRLVVRVTDDTLHVNFVPFRRRVIPLSTIASAQPRRYSPIKDFLGWGIRWMPRKGWVYSVSGDQGVQFVFQNRKKLLIGSRKPVQLADAINAARVPDLGTDTPVFESL